MAELPAYFGIEAREALRIVALEVHTKNFTCHWQQVKCA